jgi:hypothetical protein
MHAPSPRDVRQVQFAERSVAVCFQDLQAGLDAWSVVVVVVVVVQ